MKTARRIAAPWALAPDATIVPRAIIGFASDGTLTEFQYNISSEQIDSTPCTEYYNGILTPGMTNAHCHLELSNFKGVSPEATGLIGFIQKIVSQRNNFTEEHQRSAAITESRLMWSYGIQAVGDISNGEMSFPAKQQALEQGHTYYHTFAEYFGTPSAEQARAKYDADTAHIAKAKELGLAITPTPHSTYLVSEKLFDYARESDRLSIHFLETPAEIELFEQRGAMHDFLMQSGMEPDFLSHGSHVERLIDTLDPETPLLLVHCTQITETEARRLMDHFKDLTFVLCPRSNYYIERGFPPAEMLLRIGARVALGTDSLASNHSLSIASEIGWLCEHNPTLPLATALQWATLGGAAALGLADRFGSFELGKRPGAVLLEGADLRNLTADNTLTSRRLV